MSGWMDGWVGGWQEMPTKIRKDKYPYCHQMIAQTHPGGNGRVSETVEFLKNFQLPLNSLTSVKTA